MLQYQSFCSGNLQCRGTIIWDDKSLSAVLIDPTDDATPFLQFIQAEELQVKALLLTHGHVDHAASVCQVAHALHLTPQMHPADLPIYHDIPRFGSFYGIHVEPMDVEPTPLAHGQFLDLEKEFRIEVLHVPGHTPGGVTFYVPALNMAVVGDTLFRDSVGRSDLPGGNQKDLIHSIQTILYKLPPDTIAIPGHGPLTQIGYEMKHNPYVRG